MAKVKYFRDKQTKIQALTTVVDGGLYFATDTGVLFMGTTSGLVQITDNLPAFATIVLPDGNNIKASELRDNATIKTSGDKLTITKDSDGKILINSTHIHDDRYYTESEIDTKLATKANNAFSNIKVGEIVIAADNTADTLSITAGSNITLTPNATDDSLTITAKDTTYSAGTGISLNGTTFSNSGVRSIATGGSNGTILVNTNGTTANIAVKGLGSAAYTASTAYAAASHKHSAADITSVNASAITGTIAAANLPSYVDDVLEYNGTANFPSTGETGKIYTDTSTNKIYRWSGSQYVVISDSLALGTTSSTAFRGDYGNAAYAHISRTDNPHGVTKAQLGLGNVENKSSETIRGELTKADVTTALGYIPPTVDTNTHYASKNVVGTSTATSNTTSALSNGNVYLNSVENGAVTSAHKISGSGATTVTTDTSGNIIISSTNTTYGSLKNPNALTISLNGASQGAYDGSVAKSINITPSSIGAAASSHDHNRITSKGTHTETASGTTANAPTAGMADATASMYMTQSYSDSSTPANYGNIINLVGSGTGQLMAEWSGSDNTTGHLYYRSHRDTSTGGWGSWNTIIDSANIGSQSVKYATSAGSATSATTATNLSSSAGSATQPVYFSGGKPVACSYTIAKSVPSGAKFTDTTYGAATSSAAGLMSAADKSKLDALGGIITITKSITLKTDWGDTGITGTNLDTGTYVVQVSGLSSDDGLSTYSEIWSGVMSWYSSTTNSTNAEEILLHNAGHADNSGEIYLRTCRTGSNGYLKLQIASNIAGTKADSITFKFRKLI